MKDKEKWIIKYKVHGSDRILYHHSEKDERDEAELEFHSELRRHNWKIRNIVSWWKQIG